MFTHKLEQADQDSYNLEKKWILNEISFDT
jgi:hypothetical protein